MGALECLYLEAGDFDQIRAARDPLASAVLSRLSLLLAARVRAAAPDAPRAAEAAPPQATPGPGVLDELPFLRGLPYFRGLADHELAALARSPGLRLWRLERGATLFAEGAPADSAFVVVRGAFEVTRLRGQRRLRLATVGPGRLLGEFSLVDGGPRTATCTSAEPALVLEIDRAVLAGLQAEGSATSLELIQAVNRALISALRSSDARRTMPGAGWPVTSEHMDDDGRERLIATIRASVIGDDSVLLGPFGPRRMVYADYTASGRALPSSSASSETRSCPCTRTRTRRRRRPACRRPC